VKASKRFADNVKKALCKLGGEAAIKGVLLALFAPLVAGARMAWTGIKLIWGREEQAAAGYHGIAMCLIAGVIMAVAKPIAYWITGWGAMKYDSANDVYYLDANNNGVYDQNETAVPASLVNMVGKVFDIVFYIGVILLVIGLIIAGIRLVWRKRKA
jgi:hypothetical protein